MLRKAQRTEKDLATAEELTKQSALTSFILYVALVARFLAPGLSKNTKDGLVQNQICEGTNRNRSVAANQTLNPCEMQLLMDT